MAIDNRLQTNTKMVLAGTGYVDPSEPGFLISELNLKTPDSRFWHRFQIVKVVRGDSIVEWYNDLGDESLFTAGQFNILGGWIDDRGVGASYHSVDELMKMADEMRTREKLPNVVEDAMAQDLEDWADLKKGRL